MSGEGQPPARDGLVRDQVLAFMRDRARTSAPAGQPQQRAAAHARPVPSFAELPEYRKVAAHRSAGEQLGVANPFYRSHAGAAGATTVIDGRETINFASYDYLGLNCDHRVRAAAQRAIERYGLSASASRLVAGERPAHAALEQRLAAFYGVEAAVVFVSGYLTNVTLLGTLLGPEDLVVHDELIHNSALTGIKLAGAHRRFFRHNELAELDRILLASEGRHRRTLVLVEGVYSMDGDIADLPALLSLRQRFGFWLMVDEAHALGVLGATGRGTFEHFGIDPRDVDIWMGTLSKTTASCGGYVAGSLALAELLKATAGGFVYSVGLPPVLAAAAEAALDLIGSEPGRVAALAANGHYFVEQARAAGLDTGVSAGFSVVPVIVGDSMRAAQLSNELLEAGVNALPIIYPAVPEGEARLRFFVTSEHSRAQIDAAIGIVAEKLAALKSRNFGIGTIDVEAVLRQLSGET